MVAEWQTIHGSREPVTAKEPFSHAAVCCPLTVLTDGLSLGNNGNEEHGPKEMATAQIDSCSCVLPSLGVYMGVALLQGQLGMLSGGLSLGGGSPGSFGKLSALPSLGPLGSLGRSLGNGDGDTLKRRLSDCDLPQSKQRALDAD